MRAGLRSLAPRLPMSTGGCRSVPHGVGGGTIAQGAGRLDRIRSHAGTFFSLSGFLRVSSDFSRAADAGGRPRARWAAEKRRHCDCHSGGHGYVYGAHFDSVPALRWPCPTAHRFNCSMPVMAR